MESPYTTFSFQVVYVGAHNKVYRTESVTYVWSHNLLILAHMQLKKRIVSDSRAVVWWADCSYLSNSFCVMHEGKEERRKKEKRSGRTKLKFSDSAFSTIKMINGT